ncbi:MAG: LuxR family transcriptional regulator [Pseudarthrobacter sp.]|nr:LuxR family transcriptional regulator [Pseudarthrobacter sp.]
MMTSWAINQSLERIAWLCRSTLDNHALHDHALRSSVLEEIGKVSPFSAFAWPLADPETATGTSPMARIPCPEELPLLIRLKYVTPFGRWTSMIAEHQPAMTLQTATGGNPARSLLWNGLLRRYGVIDILSTVFADKHGCWGWLDLWRSDGEGVFTAAETGYLAAVAGIVTPALRHSRAREFRQEARGEPPQSEVPGRHLPQQAVLTLDAGMAVVGQTMSGADWLGLLQRGPRPYQTVPAEVLNVAAQLLAREAGVDDHPAWSRVPIGAGQWAVLRATRIDSGQPGASPPLAVTIQECPPEARLDVFARSFGLAPRQQQLVELAAGGLDTATLAETLGISPYTVQDQFKSVFAVCGVRSRNALLAMAMGTTIQRSQQRP